MLYTEYIVVFKKSATPEQINKYADDVDANGEYRDILTIDFGSDIASPRRKGQRSMG